MLDAAGGWLYNFKNMTEKFTFESIDSSNEKKIAQIHDAAYQLAKLLQDNEHLIDAALLHVETEAAAVGGRLNDGHPESENSSFDVLVRSQQISRVLRAIRLGDGRA